MRRSVALSLAASQAALAADSMPGQPGLASARSTLSSPSDCCPADEPDTHSEVDQRHRLKWLISAGAVRARQGCPLVEERRTTVHVHPIWLRARWDSSEQRPKTGDKQGDENQVAGLHGADPIRPGAHSFRIGTTERGSRQIRMLARSPPATFRDAWPTPVSRPSTCPPRTCCRGE